MAFCQSSPSWIRYLLRKNKMHLWVTKEWVETSILSKDEEVTPDTSHCLRIREMVRHWILCRNEKSSSPLPSLSDWFTVLAPSSVFEWNSVVLICQREKAWKIKTVTYYKDRKALLLLQMKSQAFLSKMHFEWQWQILLYCYWKKTLKTEIVKSSKDWSLK